MYIVFEQDLDVSHRVNRVWGVFDSYDSAHDWLKQFAGKNQESFWYGIRVIQDK